MIRQVLQLSALFTTGACLVACAGHGPRIEPEAPLAVGPTVIKTVDFSVESKTLRRSKGTAAGTLGAIGGVALGGVYGFGLGLAACGPAFFVCSPIAAVAGAGVGGVGGGVTGASLGRNGISGENAIQFNEASSLLPQKEQLQVTLHAAFRAESSHRWVIDDTAHDLITLQINKLHFEQLPDDQVRLVANGKVTARIAGRKRSVKINHTSKPHHTLEWASTDGMLQDMVDETVDAAAKQAVRKLMHSFTFTPGVSTMAKQPEPAVGMMARLLRR